MNLYEILVPTVHNDGKYIHSSFHREWDSRVRKITGGLTVLQMPAKGQWVSTNGELFIERMIPVRIMATPEKMSDIVIMTATYYNQQAVMYYRISDEVWVYHA